MTRTHCQSGRFRGVAVSNGWPHGGVLLYFLNVAFYGNWSG